LESLFDSELLLESDEDFDSEPEFDSEPDFAPPFFSDLSALSALPLAPEPDFA
jgi:hypothetical protein